MVTVRLPALTPQSPSVATVTVTGRSAAGAGSALNVKTALPPSVTGAAFRGERPPRAPARPSVLHRDGARGRSAHRVAAAVRHRPPWTEPSGLVRGIVPWSPASSVRAARCRNRHRAAARRHAPVAVRRHRHADGKVRRRGGSGRQREGRVAAFRHRGRVRRHRDLRILLLRLLLVLPALRRRAVQVLRGRPEGAVRPLRRLRVDVGRRHGRKARARVVPDRLQHPVPLGDVRGIAPHGRVLRVVPHLDQVGRDRLAAGAGRRVVVVLHGHASRCGGPHRVAVAVGHRHRDRAVRLVRIVARGRQRQRRASRRGDRHRAAARRHAPVAVRGHRHADGQVPPQGRGSPRA